MRERIQLCCASAYRFSSWIVILSLAISTGWSLTTLAADSVNINFATTVVAPTCTINVPNTLNLNTKQPGGIISPEAVEIGTVSDEVNITFSGCANGSLIRTPSITVTGRTVMLGGSELYFADKPVTTTPSVGYGVKLSVMGNTNFTDMANIASISGDNGGGQLTAKSGKTLGSLDNSTLTLLAQLSCGNYSPCTSSPGHTAGGFKASIMFQLVYD
ncbi:hypothetical protein [Morganella morganii]|uniref:hypothetical protein n=1 Tax=Morganella morganii TaxID=582 RepID=UPI0004698046|nr:hypothetical protein [Morganella morganii]